MNIRTTLLGIGGLIWIGALGCWLRARAEGSIKRGVAVRQVLLFLFLGVPFLVAGAFYTSSSYPGEVPPPPTPAPTPVALAAAPPPVPTPAPVARAKLPPADHGAAVLAAQRAAVARYPSLGIAETRFNRAYLAAYRRIQQTEPEYFDDPQWPLRLAEQVAGELAPE